MIGAGCRMILVVMLDKLPRNTQKENDMNWNDKDAVFVIDIEAGTMRSGPMPLQRAKDYLDYIIRDEDEDKHGVVIMKITHAIQIAEHIYQLPRSGK